jgi:hypothetical protein
VGLAKLCESLTDNSTIQELYLDHNNLAGSGISCLNNFLWENASLQTLSMVRCEIDEGFGEAVKGGLARNTNMTHLILADNSL